MQPGFDQHVRDAAAYLDLCDHMQPADARIGHLTDAVRSLLSAVRLVAEHTTMPREVRGWDG